MTAADFILKYLPEEAAGDFEALPEADRLEVLRHLGSPCSFCGEINERWCCYDPED